MSRHYEWLQRSPNGDLRITVFEVENPEKVTREFGETPYDDWWRQHNREVHGFDPADAGSSFPVMIHSYEAD